MLFGSFPCLLQGGNFLLIITFFLLSMNIRSCCASIYSCFLTFAGRDLWLENTSSKIERYQDVPKQSRAQPQFWLWQMAPRHSPNTPSSCVNEFWLANIRTLLEPDWKIKLHDTTKCVVLPGTWVGTCGYQDISRHIKTLLELIDKSSCLIQLNASFFQTGDLGTDRQSPASILTFTNGAAPFSYITPTVLWMSWDLLISKHLSDLT